MSVWGVTPGKEEINKAKWDKVERADIVLFSSENRIYASAVVVEKIHNKELANELWGVNEDGDTWEYIYFLDELTPRHIPVKAFNKAAGYQENNFIRGFAVLVQLISERVIYTFDLRSTKYLPEVTLEKYFEAIGLEKQLDKEVISVQRTEQNFLRNFLFTQKSVHQCVICKKEYPIQFLVAAHIKRRAECSDEERRDYKNIVVPMCKFGCDELYERGYIFVDQEGHIQKNAQKLLNNSVEEYIDTFLENKCSAWNSNTAKYFHWHQDRIQ